MRFTPKSEQQLAEENMLPAGTICDFEVVDAENATSKAGNDMIKLRIKAWAPDGSVKMLDDYLVSNVLFKVLGFAKATGKRDIYDSGDFQAGDCLNATGRLKIGVQPASGDFAAKNTVAGYIDPNAKTRDAPPSGPPPARPRQPAMASTGREIDDDIPF